MEYENLNVKIINFRESFDIREIKFKFLSNPLNVMKDNITCAWSILNAKNVDVKYSLTGLKYYSTIICKIIDCKVIHYFTDNTDITYNS